MSRLEKFIPDFDTDYYIWAHNESQSEKCLMITNLDLCDCCQKPAMINALWVMGNPHYKMIKQANEFYETYGEFTELGADSEGNCFCENCYNDHAVLED